MLFSSVILHSQADDFYFLEAGVGLRHFNLHYIFFPDTCVEEILLYQKFQWNSGPDSRWPKLDHVPIHVSGPWGWLRTDSWFQSWSWRWSQCQFCKEHWTQSGKDGYPTVWQTCQRWSGNWVGRKSRHSSQWKSQRQQN